MSSLDFLATLFDRFTRMPSLGLQVPTEIVLNQLYSLASAVSSGSHSF
jgi:hypothetical protein